MRMQTHCQRKKLVNRFINDDLEISSDNSDEEASNKYDKEQIKIKYCDSAFFGETNLQIHTNLYIPIYPAFLKKFFKPKQYR